MDLKAQGPEFHCMRLSKQHSVNVLISNNDRVLIKQAVTVLTSTIQSACPSLNVMTSWCLHLVQQHVSSYLFYHGQHF